ncbi:hypothetical protein G8C92_11210 [Paenibacillus donghaensis]|uniref:hypothetical protein n=1 Tax=Paenibacillus donghaensis TaxID=414771 RepID=UPI001883254E|nr:hypothetical protein [Paenibacillus donghaensis]MBE9914600.1 hypothetical protein [Paenibacillus donghaensis]
MPDEQTDRSYRVEMLGWFETIKRSFDPLLLKGRNRFSESAGWIGIWLVRLIIDELNKQIDLLQKLAKVNEDGFISAISTIYRLRSSDFLFNTSDLRVITDFSLFEFADYHMLYRVCEHGTTETPRIIDIDDPNYSHYSSVQLVQGTNTIEYATSDREGRTVASYWIELPSGRILIYNFHYDSTNKEMNAIIEMKEMYRYIKGICMHLEERGLLNRRGPHHAAN